jgi:hypothetical protein
MDSVTFRDYYILDRPAAKTLVASEAEDAPPKLKWWQCPLNREHKGWWRLSNLALEVQHRKHDETLISSWASCVIHEKLAEEFEKRGLSGYRLRPATVRFRDGVLSKDYLQLVVIGWAGVARPESGIRLIEECSGCVRKKYSPLEDASQLIDWSQWSGEDFFVVWPIPECLVTERVAAVLRELKVKSYNLKSPDALENLDIPPSRRRNLGFVGGPLSATMPQDIAKKYGAPLGLEPCDES